MSLTNASLLRIDLPGVPDAGGERAYAQGAAVAYRCQLSQVTRTQRFTLEAKIKGASEVAFVFLRVFPGVTALRPGTRLLVQLDGSNPVLRQLVAVNPRIKSGGLAHVELYLSEPTPRAGGGL